LGIPLHSCGAENFNTKACACQARAPQLSYTPSLQHQIYEQPGVLGLDIPGPV
jgi:hypothetical protein